MKIQEIDNEEHSTPIAMFPELKCVYVVVLKVYHNKCIDLYTMCSKKYQEQQGTRIIFISLSGTIL